MAYAVVYFPGTDLNRINDFRREYDPGWKTIRPHITLVSPISELSENSLIGHLDSVIRSLKPFPITLSGLSKSFDHYLFLLVKQGNQQIIKLHDQLYSGLLVPYLPNDYPFIPHLTLGYFGTKENHLDKITFEKASSAIEQMHINIRCKFDNLALIEGDGITLAEVIKIYNL